MSPPIRDGSGNSIGSIRLGDGTEISEVRTGTGDVVFSGDAIPDSVILRYNAEDENTTTATDSIGSNDGTLNGVGYSTDSKVGDHSFDFVDTDDDNISPPDDISNVNLDFSSDFSIAFWVKHDSTGFQEIVHKLVDVDFRIQYDANGQQRYRLENFNGSTADTVTTSSSVPTGSWEHIVLVYQADGSVEWYIDNSSDTTGSIQTDPQTTNETPAIGGAVSNDRRYLDGHVDDFMIANAALTSAEVSDTYNLA
jgi:hypothetical protein